MTDKHKEMVDVHCHILPGIDDGSKTLEQSLAMARMAVADGICLTVVTPHHLNGAYRNQADSILHHMEAFQGELNQAEIELTLVPGSELHLVPELPAELARGTAMTVANRHRAALVELPVHTVPVGADRILGQIQSQGLTPVIAHPERNAQLRRQPETLAEWVEAGCLGQVTAQSCSGRFGSDVKASARHMVVSGMIHFVASDAHRDRRRVPCVSEGRATVEAWTNKTVARLLTESYPRALAQGRPVDLGLLHQALSEQRDRKGWRRWLNI